MTGGDHVEKPGATDTGRLDRDHHDETHVTETNEEKDAQDPIVDTYRHRDRTEEEIVTHANDPDRVFVIDHQYPRTTMRGGTEERKDPGEYREHLRIMWNA